MLSALVNNVRALVSDLRKDITWELTKLTIRFRDDASDGLGNPFWCSNVQVARLRSRILAPSHRTAISKASLLTLHLSRSRSLLREVVDNLLDLPISAEAVVYPLKNLGVPSRLRNTGILPHEEVYQHTSSGEIAEALIFDHTYMVLLFKALTLWLQGTRQVPFGQCWKALALGARNGGNAATREKMRDFLLAWRVRTGGGCSCCEFVRVKASSHCCADALDLLRRGFDFGGLDDEKRSTAHGSIRESDPKPEVEDVLADTLGMRC